MTENNKTQVSLWSVLFKICKDNLTLNFLLKMVFSLFTISFLFLYFNNTVNEFISSKLIVDNEQNYCEIGVLLWTLLLISLIFFFYKIQKRQFPYVNSLFKATIIAISLLLLEQIYPHKNWFFLYYIDFGIVAVIFILFLLASFVEARFLQEKTKEKRSILLEDAPFLTSNNEDEIDKKVKSLIELIEESHFEKSFSIAVVGAWGGGKSTFLEQIKKEVQENDKKLKFISFQPYLNHAQQNVTSEFFKQVSQKLKKHIFHIDNDLLNYSKELVRDTVKSSFVDSTLDYIFPKSPSAEALFDNINYKLERLGYKIIITIDELDRLSADEILEVLKLIRTTANFHNFIFIVAVDKHYIIETLITSKKITNHHFIDKFFQLEVYLPAVDSYRLKLEFIECLNDIKEAASIKEYIEEIEKSLSNHFNMFDLYVSNFRDVKKLVNQLVWDFSTYSENMNMVDFLNFTLLKMRFPQEIKELQMSYGYNFDTNTNSFLSLKKVEGIENKDFAINTNSIQNIDVTGSKLLNLYEPLFVKYKYTKSIIDNEKEYLKHLSIRDRQILAATLINLFGTHKTSDKNHKNINYDPNFRTLIYQQLRDTDISFYEIQAILDGKLENLDSILKNESKINGFFNRIQMYNLSNVDKKDFINKLIYIVNNKNFKDVSKKNSTLIDLIIKNLELEYESEIDLDDFINNLDINWHNIEHIKHIILEINRSTSRNNEEINRANEKIFNFFIQQYEGLLNSSQKEQITADYKALASVYYALNDASDNSLKHKIKSFLSNKAELSDFIADSIELNKDDKNDELSYDSNELNLLSLRKFITDVFDTIESYIEVIEKSKIRIKKEYFEEYFDFLKLLSYKSTPNARVFFKFNKFELANIKLKEQYDMFDEYYSKLTQIVLESDDNFNLTSVVSGNILKNPKENAYFHDGKYYNFLIFNSSNKNEVIKQLNEWIINTVGYKSDYDSNSKLFYHKQNLTIIYISVL